MNMKKTIAAIAAGAVAVSAMATTVSALEAKTLTYNLVEKMTTNEKNNTGTVTAFYSDVEIKAGDQVRITTVGSTTGGSIVTISGSYYDDQGNSTKTINPTVFTNRDWEPVWNPEGAACCNWTDTVTIPVVAQKAGTAVALVESKRANIQVKIDYKDLPESINWDGALTAEIKGGLRGVKLEVWRKGADTAATTEDVFKTTAVATGSATVDASKATIKAEGTKKYTYKAGTDAEATVEKGSSADLAVTGDYTGTENMTLAYTASGWANEATGAAVAPEVLGLTLTGTAAVTAPATQTATPTGINASDFTSNAANNTKKANVTMTYVAASSEWQDAGGDAVTPSEYGITFAAGYTPSNNDKIVISAYAAATTGSKLVLKAAGAAAWDVDPANDGITVKGQAEGEMVIATTTKETKKNDDGKEGVFAKVWPADVTPITGTASNVGGSKETKDFPFRTDLNSKQDVIFSITKANGDAATVAEYEAARAIINDAVVNYSDVMFVFNAAKQNVKTEWDDKNNLKTYTRADGQVVWASYTSDAKTDGKVTNYADTSKKVIKGYHQVDDYTSFGRHYWDYDLGYDVNTIYIGNDWLGNNLFEGALVINRDLTLSLSATDKFDWTGTSLSFSWDAIQDAALTENQYANYIHNMILRTSSTWYWDSFQVVLGATEAEEVDTTSPIEGEEDELGEEEEDEPEVEDEPEEEPEEEEEPEVTEPEPEPAPVESNPGTGNAPVALAVIPVALAAAAIVAKKRG